MSGHAAPPQLAGLTFIEAIGRGGFADVFLYQQALPARRVAVKVLRESADAQGLSQFYDEANVMAQLSGHPAIVPIYQADVSPDGRAYLVMEFCPPPHLAQRYRTEKIPVPEILEIAVRISSAVETAHRAGILHRDIKPHNILTSAYGAPLLTDFGIASAAGEAATGNYGMSVPWSPPEAFDDVPPMDVRSDVFSLAATVYSLLAGRSPFEVPGGTNDMATLIHRIEHQQPSRILRTDVPDALNDLLARGLAKSVDVRPASAMAFARSVQEIQIGLHLPPTRLEVMDASTDGAAVAAPVDDARTRVRPVSIIVPDEIAQRGTRLRPRLLTEVDDRTSVHDRLAAAPNETVQRPPRPADSMIPLPTGPALESVQEQSEPQPPASRTPLLVGLAVGALVGVLVLASLLLGDEPAESVNPTGPTTAEPSVFLGGGPATPEAAKLVRSSGRVTLTWRNPSGRSGDVFAVRTGPSLAELGTARLQQETRVLLDVRAGSQVCYSIRTSRDGAASRQPLEDCGIAP